MCEEISDEAVYRVRGEASSRYGCTDVRGKFFGFRYKDGVIYIRRGVRYVIALKYIDIIGED